MSAKTRKTMSPVELIDQSAEDKPIDFRTLDINQFFTDLEGNLCQKTEAYYYNSILNSKNQPWAREHSIDSINEDNFFIVAKIRNIKTIIFGD